MNKSKKSILLLLVIGAVLLVLYVLDISNTQKTTHPEAQIVDTEYETEDIVIADIIATDEPYNADKTGQKDATQAIQKALDDCYKKGGGTVWLPAGRYKVTSTLSVRGYCTLRGDWRDPDMAGTDYGTVLLAEVPSSEQETPGLIRLGGSAGAMGLTIYYPFQSAENPKPYPYTFEIPGNAWEGSNNYNLSSVTDCTFINSYKGICASLTPSDQGLSPKAGQVHEMHNINNVKGTVLLKGLELYNCADVGIIQNVKLSSNYWADAGEEFNAPDKNIIEAFTLKNSTAFTLGDLEWNQIYNIQCSGYNIGINTVLGFRASFAGEILKANIENCITAVKADALDSRWGMVITDSNLNVSDSNNGISIENNASGKIILTACNLNGKIMGGNTEGTPGEGDFVRIMPVTEKLPEYSKRAILAKPTRKNLYVVTNKPYNADNKGEKDATKAIQKALNKAGHSGGGVVYLPAGKYKVLGNLKVPGNIELRGSSSIPNREEIPYSAGTIICGYVKKNIENYETAEALVTLVGDGAGINGLRFWYPDEDPRKGVKPYPYTIRGKAGNLYVINVGLINSYYGIDLKTYICNSHLIKRVIGCAFKIGIAIGKSDEGWIEDTLQNGTNCVRTGLPNWLQEGDLFKSVINNTSENLTWIQVDGASNEHLINNFVYGANRLFYATNGVNVTLFNSGSDGKGNGIVVDEGCDVTVINFLKLNENASKAFKQFGYLQLQ